MHAKLLPLLSTALRFGAAIDGTPLQIEVSSIAHQVYLKSFPFRGEYSVVCDSNPDAECQSACVSAFTKSRVPRILFKNELEVAMRGIKEGCTFDVIHHFSHVPAKSSSKSTLSHSIGIDLTEIHAFSAPKQLKRLNVTLVMDLRSTQSQSDEDNKPNGHPDWEGDDNDIPFQHGHRPHPLGYSSSSTPAVPKAVQVHETKKGDPAGTWRISLVQSYSPLSGECVAWSENKSANESMNASNFPLLQGNLTNFVPLQLFATDDYDSDWLPAEYGPYNIQFSIDKERSGAQMQRGLRQGRVMKKKEEQHKTLPLGYRVVRGTRVTLEGFQGTDLSDYATGMSEIPFSLPLLCISIKTTEISGRLATAILSGELEAYTITSGKTAELHHQYVSDAGNCEDCKASGGYWCSAGESFPLHHEYFSSRLDSKFHHLLCRRTRVNPRIYN